MVDILGSLEPLKKPGSQKPRSLSRAIALLFFQNNIFITGEFELARSDQLLA